MPLRYTGNTPSNVSRNAKYSVISGRDGDRVKVVYYINAREYELLTTGDHPELCEMVNKVKIELGGQPRGVFYINEFHDVLVPDGAGGCYWAGHYGPVLEFMFEGTIIGPVAPAGIGPGDTWTGPHVGVKHVLCAGANDIKFVSKNGTRSREFHLSDEVGADAAARLARRLGTIIGTSGGRFYMNEASEMFKPAGGGDDGLDPVYIGDLGEDQWFSPPDGFPRP